MQINTIGVVLLSKDNYYIKDWKLPSRPKGDKAFITELARGKKVLMSENTLKDMPKSILDICTVTKDPLDYDINFWIASFKYKPDMFIVIRSIDNLNWGSKFRDGYFEDYNQIMNINNIEMYMLKR